MFISKLKLLKNSSSLIFIGVPRLQPLNGCVSFSTKIYTKTGDKGTSSLFNGERRNKDDMIFHVLGSVDELSSSIGVAKETLVKFPFDRKKDVEGSSKSTDQDIIDKLESIQCLLLDIGSHIATPEYSEEAFKKRAQFPEEHVETLEKDIDFMDQHLQPLKNFILPGGGLVAAHFHTCRSLCRRAERDLVTLSHRDQIQPQVLKFLNRLSDYFFALSRYSSYLSNSTESLYKRQLQSSTSTTTTSKDKYQRHLEKRSTNE
ncbi:hypothetical protein DLAC_00795 [Tieghemostelium lacteum]|uniref:Corrinoid adenosyltransferase MMAB n=1 Tax=Tieghemostelium lacteum TaxID=361077 RepID=A0A152A6Y2_TIELA|nr:hypothetical protein DLAC_00795 [Tieghemostelium lacteum]|eukprot:KYR02002.1 hypothetical protein DLAC_00795 [Tieghemostelium lacteum]